jgi:hypothetical protein
MSPYTYKDWKMSEQWDELREAKLHAVPYCEKCGFNSAAKKLNVHHVNYPPVFTDTCQDDLVVLCRRCHELVHDAFPLKLFIWRTFSIPDRRSMMFMDFGAVNDTYLFLKALREATRLLKPSELDFIRKEEKNLSDLPELTRALNDLSRIARRRRGDEALGPATNTRDEPSPGSRHPWYVGPPPKIIFPPQNSVSGVRVSG